MQKRTGPDGRGLINPTHPETRRNPKPEVSWNIPWNILGEVFFKIKALHCCDPFELRRILMWQRIMTRKGNMFPLGHLECKLSPLSMCRSTRNVFLNHELRS
jgi:hypothetical protein